MTHPGIGHRRHSGTGAARPHRRRGKLVNRLGNRSTPGDRRKECDFAAFVSTRALVFSHDWFSAAAQPAPARQAVGVLHHARPALSRSAPTRALAVSTCSRARAPCVSRGSMQSTGPDGHSCPQAAHQCRQRHAASPCRLARSWLSGGVIQPARLPRPCRREHTRTLVRETAPRHACAYAKRTRRNSRRRSSAEATQNAARAAIGRSSSTGSSPAALAGRRAGPAAGR
jgi:hypothetical protein